MTPRAPVALLVAAVVASSLATAVAPAQARAVECDGKPATIVGPTAGTTTVGTEGDDVIVAPVASQGSVTGGGGNDTICLLGVSTIPPAGDFYGFTVLAGDGNDTVLNQTTETAPNGHVAVLLGNGADHFVGADYGETVYGGVTDGSAADTEVDVIDTRGGNDGIGSGTLGVGNHDVIATGTGRDYVMYDGLAGGSIDNGPDADSLVVASRWVGALAFDNVDRRATLDGQPALAWTAIDSFELRVDPGNSLSFTGNESAETLNISGTLLDVSAPTATISMGGGDDALRLENYLPAGADLGDGDDSLSWTGCRTATIALDRGVTCEVERLGEVAVALGGLEHLWAITADDLTVLGTPGADDIRAESRSDVTVRVGRGADEVKALGRGDVAVTGGPGADRLIGWSPEKRIVTLRGGGGADLLRGHWGADRLSGGLGHDTAYGGRNDDLCKAEVRHGCERH